MTSLPPFRADQVGSLLRPAELKQARARHEAGEIPAEQLKEIEDRCIEQVIRKQESIGLRGITDGEFRRAYWHFDFLQELDGCEKFEMEGIKFQGIESKPEGVRVVGKLGFSGHPMLDHFRFLQAHTNRTAKFTIPAPSVLHFRHGRRLISPAVYPDMEEFFRDLGETYRQAVAAFCDAGCRYLQLDEVNFTYLCDPKQIQMLRDRGDDPDLLREVYAQLLNAAIRGKHPDTRVTMHLCRGNFRSHWIAEGGYQPVAETLFHRVNVDGYFMEFDTERAGGFEPLALVPRGKMVVLGLVTSKSGTLESEDYLKRRLEEASRYIDLDQLCLSPQCGFASTEEGNTLTEDQQWAKLERVIKVARDVWGGI